MSFPQPSISPMSEPYWKGLQRGVLLYQRCCKCNECWLPARESCPRCLAADPEWQEASGRGEIVSWIVYHTVYDDAFKERVPYNVTVVKLEEGPRLITNIVSSGEDSKLSIGAPVHLIIEHEEALAMPRFRLEP